MPRYIDADLIEYGYLPLTAMPGLFVAKETIDKQPTADVQEVRHGEWKVIDRDVMGKKRLQCSVCCDTSTWYYDNPPNYCQECGAKNGREGRCLKMCEAAPFGMECEYETSDCIFCRASKLNLQIREVSQSIPILGCLINPYRCTYFEPKSEDGKDGEQV